jgi:transposase-like protein
MNRSDFSDYFLQPAEPSHRRYEALRAVFVEQEPMREVAQKFEVSYGTLRNWSSEFCRLQDCGEPPLFSLLQKAARLKMERKTSRNRK